MKLRLVDKKNEVSDVKSFIFEPETPIQWTAGQFMVYRLDHENPDLRGKQRFFTISSAPFEKNIMLITHIEKVRSSSFKIALNNLKIGDFIEAKGPDGDFTIGDSNEHFVFIAGGIGITPFRSILLDLVHKNQPLNITLLYANKTDEFPFKDELENLSSKHSTFNIHYVISPEHIDQQLIEQKIEDYKSKIFYISGPEKMVEDLGEMLKKMGIKEEKIKQDFFPGYTSI